MGSIYLSVNAKDVANNGSQLTTMSESSAVILSCKTSPSMIDAVNSEVSSSINSATSAVGGSPESDGQQPVSFIDTSTCAATCARCGVYVGDGQIVDREEQEEGEEETVPRKGNFFLADLSNIRFIRHRVLWQEETKTENLRGESEASLLLRKRMSTEQVFAHLLTAAASLYGSSTFEFYVPDVPR